jgi:hypothetical protein
MSIWIMMDTRFGPDVLGFLPDIILSSDRRPVKEQLQDRYAHGGGYRHIPGFTMDEYNVMTYPGDPPYKPTAAAMINGELVIFYRQGSLLAILKSPTEFEVTRVD